MSKAEPRKKDGGPKILDSVDAIAFNHKLS